MNYLNHYSKFIKTFNCVPNSKPFRKKKGNVKGGYLHGKIKAPQVKGKLRMVIQTQCIDEGPHPCLIHVRRGHGKKFLTHLEPEPSKHSWKQTFNIEKGKVKIKNTKRSDRDIRAGVPEEDEVTKVQESFIRLGKEDGNLKLMIIQPTVKECEGIIEDRIPTASSKDKKRLQEKFTKNKKHMKRVQLKVDFYNDNDEHCGSDVSQIIVDSNDRDVGPMEFSEIHPSKSCVNGGRKIVMFSESDLPKDVRPVFQVFDKMDVHRADLDQLLMQPQKIDIDPKKGIIKFIAPHQPKFQDLKNILGSFKIKLMGKREWDGYESNKDIFNYEEHTSNCMLCHHNLDSNAPSPASLSPRKQSARPGFSRRTMDQPRQENIPNTILRTLSSASQDSGSFSAEEEASVDDTDDNTGIQLAEETVELTKCSNLDQDCESDPEANPSIDLETLQNCTEEFATVTNVEKMGGVLSFEEIENILKENAAFLNQVIGIIGTDGAKKAQMNSSLDRVKTKTEKRNQKKKGIERESQKETNNEAPDICLYEWFPIISLSFMICISLFHFIYQV